MIAKTVIWYKTYYNEKKILSFSQLEEYCKAIK